VCSGRHLNIIPHSNAQKTLLSTSLTKDSNRAFFKNYVHVGVNCSDIYRTVYRTLDSQQMFTIVGWIIMHLALVSEGRQAGARGCTEKVSHIS
jgi:hypothetical protein